MTNEIYKDRKLNLIGTSDPTSTVPVNFPKSETPRDSNKYPRLANLQVYLKPGFRLPRLQGIEGEIEDTQVFIVRTRLEQHWQYDGEDKVTSPGEPKNSVEEIADRLYGTNRRYTTQGPKFHMPGDEEIRLGLRLK